MKLFNLNIGIRIDNNKEVVGLILKDSYDIVTLQESLRKLDDNVISMFDSGNVIKTETKYKNSFFGALWTAKQLKKNGIVKRDYGGYVEQGNQLLTNFSIMKSRNVFYYKEFSNFEDATNFKQEDHPRAFAEVVLDIGGNQLQIINVHGSWNIGKTGNARTQNQTIAILDNIRYDIPSIVVGDFNLLPETQEIKALSSKMTNLIEKYNIKSTRPNFDDGIDKGDIVCDYIFVNDKVKVKDFCVLKSNASDHYPLVLDFEI